MLLDGTPIAIFALSFFCAGVLYGDTASRGNFFPASSLKFVKQQVNAVLAEFGLGWGFAHDALKIPDDGSRTRIVNASAVAKGVILVVGLTADYSFARVVERDGTLIHEWRLDWFALGRKNLRLPSERIPITRPGTQVHGAAILDDGDIVFNFEHLSTVRLDICGRVEWMLDNLGHHSVEQDQHGNIWVPAERFVPAGDATGFANHRAPLRDWTLQKISPTGETLKTMSIIDILIKNDLPGLLHLSSIENSDITVQGDTLHLNDLEVFPPTLKPGLFHHGDLLLSLRNINTVLVVDPDTYAIRYRIQGPFLRQHDPDFLSGDEIIVFDNYTKEVPPGRSRILKINAALDTVEEVFIPHDPPASFFTGIMGKLQLLPNGNLLVAASWEGRALELTPDGKMVWEYVNALNGSRGIITQATLLPSEKNEAYFAKLRSSCSESPLTNLPAPNPTDKLAKQHDGGKS